MQEDLSAGLLDIFLIAYCCLRLLYLHYEPTPKQHPYRHLLTFNAVLIAQLVLRWFTWFLSSFGIS